MIAIEHDKMILRLFDVIDLKYLVFIYVRLLIDQYKNLLTKFIHKKNVSTEYRPILITICRLHGIISAET